MKKLIYTALALTITISACKKKDNTKTEPTKTENLKSGKWKLAELKFTNTNGEQDLLGTIEECSRDNYYYFNTDNSITVDEGSVKCNSSDPQTTTDGKWELTSDNSKLSFKESAIFGTKSNMTLNVVSISAEQIKFSKDSTISIPGIGELVGKFTGTFSNVK